MSFAELQAHVEENVFLNIDWFAEEITLRSDAGVDVTTTAHCKYSVREQDGVVIETLSVSFAKDAAPNGCDHQYRIYRANDDRAFLWRFNGTETANRYRAIFERRTRKTQGTK